MGLGDPNEPDGPEEERRALHTADLHFTSFHFISLSARVYRESCELTARSNSVSIKA